MSVISSVSPSLYSRVIYHPTCKCVQGPCTCTNTHTDMFACSPSSPSLFVSVAHLPNIVVVLVERGYSNISGQLHQMQKDIRVIPLLHAVHQWVEEDKERQQFVLARWKQVEPRKAWQRSAFKRLTAWQSYSSLLLAGNRSSKGRGL